MTSNSVNLKPTKSICQYTESIQVRHAVKQTIRHSSQHFTKKLHVGLPSKQTPCHTPVARSAQRQAQSQTPRNQERYRTAGRFLPGSPRQERTCVRDWSGDNRKARPEKIPPSGGINTTTRLLCESATTGATSSSSVLPTAPPDVGGSFLMGNQTEITGRVGVAECGDGGSHQHESRLPA